jgi:pantothenate kinase-related protein Tda10
MYKEALTVLTDVIMTDDQEVEAWYLEGWCFMLMGEDAKEKGIKVEDLSWDELARDARDCLETCKHVSLSFRPLSSLILFPRSFTKVNSTRIPHCCNTSMS